MEWIEWIMQDWVASHRHTDYSRGKVYRRYPNNYYRSVGAVDNHVEVEGSSTVYIEAEGVGSLEPTAVTEEKAKALLPILLSWLEANSGLREFIAVKRLEVIQDAPNGLIHIRWHDLGVYIQDLEIHLDYGQKRMKRYYKAPSERAIVDWLDGITDNITNPTMAYLYYLLADKYVNTTICEGVITTKYEDRWLKIGHNRIDSYREPEEAIGFTYYSGDYALGDLEDYVRWLMEDD